MIKIDSAAGAYTRLPPPPNYSVSPGPGAVACVPVERTGRVERLMALLAAESLQLAVVVVHMKHVSPLAA